MPSRQTILKQRAHRFGVHPFRYPPGFRIEVAKKVWDIVLEAESFAGPRDLRLTKREAILLANRIAHTKKSRIDIEVS